MKIRITVDRRSETSYVYLPVRGSGLTSGSHDPIYTKLKGVALDINRDDELLGIEIDGMVTEVEFADITGDEP